MSTFDSLLGFLVAWTDIFIGQPVGNAVVLLTLGRYVCRPFFIDCKEMPRYAAKCFSLTFLGKCTSHHPDLDMPATFFTPSDLVEPTSHELESRASVAG